MYLAHIGKSWQYKGLTIASLKCLASIKMMHDMVVRNNIQSTEWTVDIAPFQRTVRYYTN